MFNKNVFTQKDPIADIVKGINEADYKAKMEELKGNQHKIDKNKNNKIDAHDFAILRGEKKAVKEEEEQVDETSHNNPFDYKNYKSQLPTKPGEKAGFDSKKISTGTVYSRKPVKDEPMKKESAPAGANVRGSTSSISKAATQGIGSTRHANNALMEKGKEIKKEEIDPDDTTTDTLKGREKTSANPFLSKKVKMDVPDNVKEDVEQIDELKKSTVKSYMNKKVDRIHKDADLQYPFKPIPITKKEVEKNTKDLMRGHARLSGVKPTSEEVEHLDEANTETKQEFLARQQRLAAAHSETQKDPKRLARLMKIPGYSDAMKLAQKTTQKEEYEQVDEAVALSDAKTTAERLVKKTIASHGISNPTSAKHHAKNASAIEATLDRAKRAFTPGHLANAHSDAKTNQAANRRTNERKSMSSAETRTHKALQAGVVKHLQKHLDQHNAAFRDAAAKFASKNKTNEEVEQMDERTLTKGETAEKERIVKGMKKSLAGFKARYGDKAKSVMYATATKAAKKD